MSIAIAAESTMIPMPPIWTNTQSTSCPNSVYVSDSVLTDSPVTHTALNAMNRLSTNDSSLTRCIDTGRDNRNVTNSPAPATDAASERDGSRAPCLARRAITEPDDKGPSSSAAISATVYLRAEPTTYSGSSPRLARNTQPRAARNPTASPTTASRTPSV